MKTSKFNDDLALGGLAESYVLKLLNGCGLKASPVNVRDRKFWDVQATVPADWTMPHNLLKLEVKYDKYQQKTGNIAIEVWNTTLDQPSGLSVTQADLWVCVLQNSMWVAKTSFLKMFVFNSGLKPKRTIENAGDGNARIYLYTDKEILSIFHRVDTLTKQDVFYKLRELCKRR